MPSLRLASPALLAARRGPRPWLRCPAGARRGIFCSLEASRRGDGESEEEKRRGDGARAAAERRLRGGNAVAGSGELLAIPGVGPRNLRKLVDNGFEGVAHLKQLYRDKVRVPLLRFVEAEMLPETCISATPPRRAYDFSFVSIEIVKRTHLSLTAFIIALHVLDLIFRFGSELVTSNVIG
jgi:hypothetical protein